MDVRLVEERRKDLNRQTRQYSEQYHRNKDEKTDVLHMRIFRIGRDFEHFNMVQVIELLVES